MHPVLKQKYTKPSLVQAENPATREAEAGGSHNKYKSYLNLSEFKCYQPRRSKKGLLSKQKTGLGYSNSWTEP